MDGSYDHLVALGILSGAGIVVLAAAVEDARHYRIPNAYCLALVLLFPLYVLVSPVPVAWIWNLTFAAGIFCFGALAYRTGKFGAGDAKMMAAAGLWAGPSDIVAYLIITALAGGVMALLLVALTIARTLASPIKVSASETVTNTDAAASESALHRIAGHEQNKSASSQSLSQDFKFKTRIPYGVAIASGACTVLAGLALPMLSR